MNPRIWRTLGGFYHRVARRLTVMQPKRDTAGRWEYLPLDAAMTAVELEEMEKYILSLQNTTTQ